MKKNKHTPSNQELKKLADEVLEDAKKNKKIVSYKEAFKEFPSCYEVHEGKEDYYLKH